MEAYRIMKLKTLTGRDINVNITHSRVDWGGKSRSKIQKRIKDLLFEYWWNDIVAEEFIVPRMLLRIDLINFSKKIAVEVDGNQHTTYNKFFHKGDKGNLTASVKRDFKKAEWLEVNGILLINIDEKLAGKITQQELKDLIDTAYNKHNV